MVKVDCSTSYSDTVFYLKGSPRMLHEAKKAILSELGSCPSGPTFSLNQALRKLENIGVNYKKISQSRCDGIYQSGATYKVVCR